jgi:hypothetical protein
MFSAMCEYLALTLEESITADRLQDEIADQMQIYYCIVSSMIN